MVSYLRYKQELRTVQDADDIESWITVRGNHIPIKKGQSKEDAVKSFIEGKKKNLVENHNSLVEAMNLEEKGYFNKDPKKRDSITQSAIEMGKEEKNLEELMEFGIKEANNAKTESKYSPEFEVVRKNALANGNVYGGKYTQKSKAEAYKEYKNDTSSKENMKKANEFVNGKPESSKKWSESWKPSAKQKQEAGFRLLEIGYNDVDFGKDPAKNKQNVLEAIKESGTENANYLTNIVKNMPDNSFSDIEKFRTGVKNAKKDLSSSKKESSGWIESPKFDKLTKQYMPASGEADNELGETLRSINRVVYRYYNDGDMWNKGYGKETVNWAVKHLAEVAKNKNTPKHIARGIENGLYEMKTYGVKDKDRYETALKILVQTMEFADKTEIESLSKIKRSTKKATDSWHKLWGKK